MSSPSSADGAPPPLAAPDSLAIHLDAIGGIAGDMFVAAIVDALPQLEAPILRELACVQPRAAASPSFTEASTGGLRARRFGAVMGAALPRVRGTPVRATRRQHVGASYRKIHDELCTASLGEGTRRHALALLRLLGEAEAAVHGIAVDDVHFHELADWDSRMDLVAAGCIAAHLEGARWTVSALPIGGGTITTAHGVLPVPAPATSALLVGFAWHDDGVPGERVTPTGAAILRHLVDPRTTAEARPTGRLVATGGGAGTRVLAGRPNLLRAVVFDTTAPRNAADDPAMRHVDAVALIEFDLDDMTGEEIGLAAERLRALPGTLDVTLGTRFGKKGRPVTDVRVLGRVEATQAIARACFQETTTLGLRIREERRHVLARDEVAAAVGGGSLRVKVAERPGGGTTAKAEHDDVAETADLRVRRDARDAAVDAALKRRKR
jgi:uncharacterized protein (TIGR00299 family) protein